MEKLLTVLWLVWVFLKCLGLGLGKWLVNGRQAGESLSLHVAAVFHDEQRRLDKRLRDLKRRERQLARRNV